MSVESDEGMDRPDPEEMDMDSLRTTYANLREESMSGLLDESEWEWMHDAWNELRSRVDVDQPECPECGARNWGFGDHISCNECDRPTEFDEDDLRAEIQKAWTAIIRGGDSDV